MAVNRPIQSRTTGKRSTLFSYARNKGGVKSIKVTAARGGKGGSGGKGG